MKHFSLFFLALFLQIPASFAQQIVYSNFESWKSSYSAVCCDEPNAFFSSNTCICSITDGCSCVFTNVVRTTDKYNGTFAAKLTVIDFYNTVKPAYLDNNHVDQGNPYAAFNTHRPYWSINIRPTSVSANVKFSPVSGDNATIFIILFDGATSVGSGVIKMSSEIASYSHVEADVTYKETFTGTPNGISYYIICGDTINPKVGTTLYVDDFTFSYNVATSAYSQTDPVTLFTDAQAGNLHFSKKVKEVSFTDMTGKTIQSSGAAAEDVPIIGLKPGLYMVRYQYNSNTYIEKIVIQ